MATLEEFEQAYPAHLDENGDLANGIWVTRLGDCIHIDDMSTEHRRNTVAMLKRQLAAMNASEAYGFPDDMPPGEISEYLDQKSWYEAWIKRMEKE
jgi:hypothetical protein